MTPPRLAAITLGATLAIQMFTSIAGTCAAVLAPAIAAEFGVAPRWIGAFVGLVYAGAMTASLASGGFIERYGAIRTSQACVGICAVGVGAMALTPPGAPLGLALAALVIGLGYGPITPASSELLARTTPPHRMALTFSIKQTGVPAGAALAGAILPSLAHAAGWRAALGAIALGGIAIVALAQPIRARLDATRDGSRRVTLTGVLAPLVHLRQREVRQLALVGLAYAATQVCLTSFLVVFLTEVLGYPLVAAGLALSAATVGGVVGRLVWGTVADRWLSPRRTLALVGILAGAGSVALALAQPWWPTAACLLVGAGFGATAIGWNGVQLAEVARQAPAGAAGPVTGAAGFVTFSGVVAGPPLFALVASLTGSFRFSFLMMGALSAGTALWMLGAVRRGS